MRVLYSTFGSLGDIHPYLALAGEAKRRGHEPILATSPKYRAKIESLGFQFRPVRPDLPDESEFSSVAQLVMDAKKGPENLFKKVLTPSLRQSYLDLLEAGADADCIITHPAALAGPLAARKLGKFWLSSVLAPISLWSIFDPGVPATLPGLDILRLFGPLWGWGMREAGKCITRSWVAAVEELCREENLPYAHPIFEGQYSPHGTLALFSRHYAARQRDWPENTVLTGFPFFDRTGLVPEVLSTPSEWRSWLARGEAPIVATLGSAATHAAGDFWQLVFRSAHPPLQKGEVDPALRLLMVTGKTGVLQGWPEYDDMPEHAGHPDLLEVQYTPYSEVFPRALCVVHQGGIGTTAQALRAGVPQIVVPFAQDQPDNAARIARLGVGINASGLRQLPFEETVARCADRAASLGHRIRSENAPLQACLAMEKLAA